MSEMIPDYKRRSELLKTIAAGLDQFVAGGLVLDTGLEYFDYALMAALGTGGVPQAIYLGTAVYAEYRVNELLTKNIFKLVAPQTFKSTVDYITNKLGLNFNPLHVEEYVKRYATGKAKEEMEESMKLTDMEEGKITIHKDAVTDKVSLKSHGYSQKLKSVTEISVDIEKVIQNFNQDDIEAIEAALKSECGPGKPPCENNYTCYKGYCHPKCDPKVMYPKGWLCDNGILMKAPPPITKPKITPKRNSKRQPKQQRQQQRATAMKKGAKRTTGRNQGKQKQLQQQLEQLQQQKQQQQMYDYPEEQIGGGGEAAIYT